MGAVARPRAAKKTRKARSPKLYWVTTADHGEDWFVVALGEGEACVFHEDAEGFDRGDADAELVCRLPAALSKTKVGWPSDDVLNACGAEIVSPKGKPRVVKIDGRVFGEGDVFENAAARLGTIERH